MELETVRNHLLTRFKKNNNSNYFVDRARDIHIELRRHGYVVQAKVGSYHGYSNWRWGTVTSLKALDARINRRVTAVAERLSQEKARVAAAEAEYVTFSKVFDEVTAGSNMPIELNTIKHYMGNDQSAYIKVNEEKFPIWLTGDHDIAVARIQVDFRINDQRYLIPLEDFINDPTIAALFLDKTLARYAS